MQTKLSDLVDNLSEINNKDCKRCIERKNIKSECEFIGIYYIINAKNVEKDVVSQKWINRKVSINASILQW